MVDILIATFGLTGFKWCFKLTPSFRFFYFNYLSFEIKTPKLNDKSKYQDIRSKVFEKIEVQDF